MKLILSSICALVLTSIAQADLHNDLYYHHHPQELAKMNNRNQLHNNYANSHRYEGHRSNYGHNRYHRGNYHDNGRANYHDANYREGRHRIEPRGEKNSIYNEDGSINYSYRAQQPDVTNRRQYHRPNHRYEGEPRSLYGGDDYDEDSYDAYYDDDYQEDRYHRGNQYDDYYSDGNGDNYGGQSSDSRYDGYNGQSGSRNGQPSSGNDDYSGQSGSRYDDYNGQSNSGYDDYNGQADNGQQTNSDNDFPQVNQKYANDRYSKSGTGFGGGLRLAGALPDDGYNRGTGTFYDLETHVSSCGQQHKNSEVVASVNTEQMGDGCGKQVEVVGPNGKSIKALVVGSCKTCKENALDLSPAAFGELGEFSQASIPIKWKFV